MRYFIVMNQNSIFKEKKQKIKGKVVNYKNFKISFDNHHLIQLFKIKHNQEDYFFSKYYTNALKNSFSFN